MGVRENKVERYLDSRIRNAGGITRKWVSPGMDGVPDRIVILRGTVIFVEVKTVNGALSPAQVREHQRLTDHGAIVETIYGESGVDRLIEKLMRRYM